MDYLCFAAVAPLRTNTEAIAFRTARTSSLASGSAFSTMSSAVKPSARLALTSAPSARSSSATALWPDSTAQCSGVCFRGLVSSGSFNCVPLAMCSRTAPTSPARAASQIEIAGGAVNLGRFSRRIRFDDFSHRFDDGRLDSQRLRRGFPAATNRGESNYQV